MEKEERERELGERLQQEGSAKLAVVMTRAFQAADNNPPPPNKETESSHEEHESSQLVFSSNSDTVSGKPVLAGNRFESLVKESEDDQFPPLPSLQFMPNPRQAVGGEKKKQKNKARDTAEIRKELIALPKEVYEVERAALDKSIREYSETRKKRDERGKKVSNLEKKCKRR